MIKDNECYSHVTQGRHYFIRDWSLITGGGLQNRRGACEVLPLRKGGGGGGEKVLDMLKDGTKSLRVVFTW